ncbi:MAG TPA: hypothetical protein PKJ08_03130 [Candidatus Cloacimonadota bacterium]|nr:hypothetical protein [Candidatus Cloacimonadota bacterium]HOD53501.1 hypothetical protein [Candidatus Cloacimonadota bacterium]HPM01960.1 hypothetical protein [Candidatus Cloacimonadota bacterium]
MDSKTDKKVNQFLETNNMDYLFLILANLEVDRLSNLPDGIKKGFSKKISDMALEHAAINDIPDYILEYSETEADEYSRNIYRDDDDEDDDFQYEENIPYEEEPVREEFKDEKADDSFQDDEDDDDFDEDDDFYNEDSFDDED